MRTVLAILLLSTPLLATDLTPSIKTAIYLTGADHISAASVFQRTAGDDSTFFKRYEYLIGVGEAMEAYLDEMYTYSTYWNFYISGTDMPVWNGLSSSETSYVNLGRKHNFITSSAVGEDYWMHYHDATTVNSNSVTGTGSMTIDDGDSTDRVWHYSSSWGGNTYTYGTRPIFNFTSQTARDQYTAFVNAILNDSSDTWFDQKTVAGDSGYLGIYLDNFDTLRLKTFTATAGGAVVELDSQLVNSDGAVAQYWDSMKVWMGELHNLTSAATGDSLRVSLNAGSSNWSWDYSLNLPTGSIVNFEYGFSLLQIDVYAAAYDFNILELAAYDSAAADHGITFMYCAGPYEQVNSTYLTHGTWDGLLGFSQAKWSVYDRMCLYYLCRSDSTLLYAMPEWDAQAYQGYAYGSTYPVYDWGGDSIAFYSADFDTLSWSPSFQYDIGTAQSMPVLDTSWAYTCGSGYTANVYRREYGNAWVYGRPLDGHPGDPLWWGLIGADSCSSAMTVALQEECRVLLPDGTLSDSSFSAFDMNSGDGFVFVKTSALEKVLQGTVLQGTVIQ